MQPLQTSKQLLALGHTNSDNELSPNSTIATPNISDLEVHKYEKGSFPSDFEADKSKDSRKLARLKGRGQKNQHSNETSPSSPRPSITGDRMKGLSQDDVIIVLMGPTGSGKSTFINTVANANIAVGHNLQSCTSEIGTVRLAFPELVDSNVVLVDTPGFDHTGKTDVEILKMVADWLKATYENDILLSGVLYFHPISNIQMAGTSMKHLRIFEELCGKNALKNVLLVTTMWDEVDEDTGNMAEEKMKTKYWNKMLERNSMTGRFLGTRESAVGLLLPLIDAARKRSSLLLQHEMVDMGKKLIETSAGRQLFARAERIVHQRQEVIERIQNEMRRPTGDITFLEDERQELNQRLEQTIEEMRVLDLPVGRRFLETGERWFSKKLSTLKLVLVGKIKTQDVVIDCMEGKTSRWVNGAKRSLEEAPGERKAELDPNEAITMPREAKVSSSGRPLNKSLDRADGLAEPEVQTEVKAREAKNPSNSQPFEKSPGLGEDQTGVMIGEAKIGSGQPFKKHPVRADEPAEDQIKVKTREVKNPSNAQFFKKSPIQVDESGEDQTEVMSLVLAGAIL